MTQRPLTVKGSCATGQMATGLSPPLPLKCWKECGGPAEVGDHIPHMLNVSKEPSPHCLCSDCQYSHPQGSTQPDSYQMQKATPNKTPELCTRKFSHASLGWSQISERVYQSSVTDGLSRKGFCGSFLSPCQLPHTNICLNQRKLLSCKGFNMHMSLEPLNCYKNHTISHLAHAQT